MVPGRRQCRPGPPPHLIVQALLILRHRILEGPQGFLPWGEAGDVQTADGPAQLVLDAVLHGAPEIGAQCADVLRGMHESPAWPSRVV